MTATQTELLAQAYECADDCDTCWYLITDTAEEEMGMDQMVIKLRAHLASGHRTTSEDDV